jgi:RNA polymerase sigma factor (sigma-70 family)
MDQIPDKKIIRGILEHKSLVIQTIYNECFPMVERMVINSGGDHDQAKDIFQEGWIIIYRKLSEGEFELTCKFSTYLYAVCKKVWMQERRKKNYRMKQQISDLEVAEEPEAEPYESNNRVKNLFLRHFRQLSKDCQKILILHCNDITIDEIQKIMNYQNSHYTMDRKYRCKKSLIQRILNDPNYKSVKYEYSEQTGTLRR